MIKRTALFLALALSAFQFASANPNYFFDPVTGKVKLLIDMPTPAPKTVDVLFVVDNSGSMQTHQKNLAAAAPVLVKELMDQSIDFHAGVVTTTMDPPWGKEKTPSQGQMLGTPVSIDRSMPNAGELLIQRLVPGTDGGGTERHFDAILAALTEPLRSGGNAGFFRANAGLAVVVLTDADDQSQVSPDDFVASLKNIKAATGGAVTIQGLIVPSTTPEQECSRNGEEKPAKIEMAIKALGGEAFSLCAKQYADNIRSIGKSIANVSSKYVGVSGKRIRLPSAPEFETITVTYGSQVIAKGDATRGWVFNANSNEIQIGGKVAWTKQPDGTPLDITYVPVDWK